MSDWGATLLCRPTFDLGMTLRRADFITTESPYLLTWNDLQWRVNAEDEDEILAEKETPSRIFVESIARSSMAPMPSYPIPVCTHTSQRPQNVHTHIVSATDRAASYMTRSLCLRARAL